MSKADLTGLLRWPAVPACYGWLSLDRRGCWRLQGEAVSHSGLIAFLNRQYGCDDQGNYFVQNGPQRVYVKLDYAPWVVRLDAGNVLKTHTGESVGRVNAAIFDEDGNMLLEIPAGIALLCDRDLPALLTRLRQPSGEMADESSLLALLEQNRGMLSSLTLDWQGEVTPVLSLERATIASRYGFIADPAPPMVKE